MFGFGKRVAKGDLFLTHKLGLYVLDDVDDDGNFNVRALATRKQAILKPKEVAAVYPAHELTV